MSERIKVMIVEDDPDWLRGLSSYLRAEPDLDIVAEASTGDDAIAAAGRTSPDVVLMDIMLADSPEGIELTWQIVERFGAKVIMLSSMEDKDLILDAFRAGAVNYLVKTNFDRIPEAIRAAYSDVSPIDARVAEQMREEYRRLKQLEQEYKAKQLKDLLTPTELTILSLIDDGHSQSQIADKLVVSIRTVKVHIGNILRKMNGTSSKEAARKAKDMGIL